MGRTDTQSRHYLSANSYFSDLFNYVLYNGEQIILPKNLKELDTSEIIVPYGNGAGVPRKKVRDLFKVWSAKTDGKAYYLMLGVEFQAKTHYAMPVRNALYDMIGYADQVEESSRSYRKKNKSSNLIVADGTIKFRLSGEEFLSGFRKTDKLIPIITVVVSLSGKSWDGPRSLYDMLDIRDDVIRKFVPDYKMNLLSPADMDDEEFDRFHTDLGFALNMLKHQKKGADEVIRKNADRLIDRDTAEFLNNTMDLNLEYEEEDGGINMCRAMELKEKRDINRGRKEGRKEGRIEGRIEGREEIMLQVFQNCIDRGMSREDAIAISGITESVLKRKLKQLS